MPVVIIVQVIEALVALAPQVPAVIQLAESAIGIVKTGRVTPDQEAMIRAQLDQVKALIDAA